MIIRDIRKQETRKGSQTLSASLVFETPRPRQFEIYYRHQDAPAEISSAPDPFLIEFLFPAMMLGEDIHIEGDVDPELLFAIREKITPLIRNWFPFLNEIVLDCGVGNTSPPRSTPGATAMAFSSGLDACYTAAKNIDQLDWLIAAWGFDVRSYQEVLWQKSVRNIGIAARTLEKPLYVIQTNVRQVSHYEAIATRRGRINPAYYRIGGMGAVGTFLAALGRTLAPSCSRFLLSAGVRYENLRPFGSHPQLDAMWSTTTQEVLHEGCEADRMEKITFLKRNHPEMLGCLRVCFIPNRAGVNCSRCEKCLRTMADIRLAEADHLAHSFQWPLDLEQVRNLKLDGRRLIFWNRLRVLALELGDKKLAEAIHHALKNRSRLDEFLSMFRSESRNNRLLARHHWKRIRRIMKSDEHGKSIESL